MRRPDLPLLVKINASVRNADEWFDEPDELDRVERVANSIAEIDDPIEASARLAARIARSQAFGEGNKRTALMAAVWLLDRNGLDPLQFLPPSDMAANDLLIKASVGNNVEEEMMALLDARRSIDLAHAVEPHPLEETVKEMVAKTQNAALVEYSGDSVVPALQFGRTII